MINAMSIDVEEHFQVSAFEGHIDRGTWDGHPSRVEQNVERILELLDDHGTNATFFILGWIAQRHHRLVERIANAGHEVASHGFNHVRVTSQTPAEFRQDVEDTKRVLEDICGTEVIGFRAASFSIGSANLWALDVLAEAGYRYSSSVNPIRHDHYGSPSSPRVPFRAEKGGLLEVPISTIPLLGNNLPCGGGGYFRILPYRYFRWAIRRLNEGEGRPSVFYFHPWEIDPDQPRQRGVGLKTRIRHYFNLHRMEPKLRRLLADFRWERMDRVFLDGSAHGVKGARTA
jgi:polysaccharide deacetylase family protein (PEP-CTERM system associated)